MPHATGSDLHVDRLLSQMAIGFFQNTGIAGLIMPQVNVQNQTDLYSIFLREDELRVEDSKRSPDTEANKITRSISSDSYRAENYALKTAVTIEDRSNADPVFRQELIEDGARFVSSKLALDWEVRVAALVNNTSNVGSSAGVASAWTAYGSSDPIGDCEVALDNVQDTTGKRPNTVVMGLGAWRAMKRNTAIRNLIKGTNNGGGYPSAGEIASQLEVGRILVGGAYKNNAEQGLAESLVKVWNDYDVTLMYVPGAPSRREPSWGYSFRWTAPGLPNMQAERHPYDTKRKSEEVEVGYYQDEKVTGAEYAYTLLAVDSST